MKKSLKIIITLSVVVLLSAGCSERLFGVPRDGTSTKIYGDTKQKLDEANQKQQKRTQENPPATNTFTVTQTVEASNFIKPDYQVKDGTNAFELLKNTHQVLSKSYSGIGEFVESIDGIKPDSKHFWSFYVNGKPSEVGASSYVLKDGDKVGWKLDEIK